MFPVRVCICDSVCTVHVCLSQHSTHTYLTLVLSQVAVLAHGIHGNETPFTFGSTVPRMTFHWTVTNMDVFSLVSVYEKVHVCDCVCAVVLLSVLAATANQVFAWVESVS